MAGPRARFFATAASTAGVLVRPSRWYRQRLPGSTFLGIRDALLHVQRHVEECHQLPQLVTYHWSRGEERRGVGLQRCKA